MSRSLTRRTLLGALAASALGSSAACSRVPTSGPVEQVSPASQAPVERGVQVHPAEPQPDGTPDVVLAGFLEAMASLEPDFFVAKQYLTPKAAANWDPGSGVVVFNGDQRTTLVTDRSAVLQAPLVGELDGSGHFTSVTGVLRHDFAMTQVEGQWRIGRPPRGLLVSSYAMLHRFSPAQLWFLDPSGAHLVPEQVWLTAAPLTPTLLVQALLRGPSAWLRPGVTSAIPTDTRLTAPAVTVGPGGVAEVGLSETVNALPEDQRLQLAAQLVATLCQLEEVQRVQVRVGGKAWSVSGSSADGSVGEDAVVGFLPVARSANSRALAVSKQVVAHFDEPQELTPVTGALGLARVGDQPVQLVASDVGSRTAVLVNPGGRVQLASTDVPGEVVTVPGKGVVQLQFDAVGNLWLLDGQAALRRVRPDGQVDPVVVTLPKGHRLVRFSLSPAGATMAVVTEVGGARHLGMCLVHGSQNVVADGYRPIRLDDSQQELTWVLDVAWPNPERMMVLAAADRDGRAGVLLVSSDGASLDPVGPTGDGQPRSLVVQPTRDQVVALLLLDGGNTLRYESPWRWRGLPLALAAAAYPR